MASEAQLRKIFNDIAKGIRTSGAVRALGELALARLRLALVPARRLPLQQAAVSAPLLSPDQQVLVKQVTYVVPRIARRLPFKSDCLVQALAAHRWLTGAGVPVTIHLGGRKDAAGTFEAHAWSTTGDHVITGWDIDRFGEFAAFPPGP